MGPRERKISKRRKTSHLILLHRHLQLLDPPTNTSRVGVKLTRRPKSGIPQHNGLDNISENSETEANEKEKTSESQMTEDLSEVLKYPEQRRHMEEEDRVKKQEERRKYREHHNLPA